MKNSYFPYTFFENEFVKTEDAKVSIMTNALQYGTAVFGGIRGYYNKKNNQLLIFRPHDHFERFLNSLRILGVKIPFSRDELVDILIQLAKKNNPKQNTYFRPFAYADSLLLAPNLARDNIFGFALYSIPLNDYLPTDKGLSVKVSSWRRVSDNAVPARGKISGAYINSALARKDAYDDGYDEAIVLTEAGDVAEGSAENLFIVKNNVLYTPSVNEDILEGITRRSIIRLALDMEIQIGERKIDRTELYTADEVFFSGTGVQIAWISQIDKRPVGNAKLGPITKRLRDSYFDIVQGKKEHYKNWITPVSLV